MEEERTEFTNKEILIFVARFFLIICILILFLHVFTLQFHVLIDMRFIVFVLADIYILFEVIIPYFPKKFIEKIFDNKIYANISRFAIAIFAIILNILYWDIAKDTVWIKWIADIFS